MIGDLGGIFGKVGYEVECAAYGTTNFVCVQMNGLNEDLFARHDEKSGLWSVNG
ncbi:hypothetical protein Alches_23280 [Alicyclobacillus hesperidum subsp. aegles]|nr:hypothetical protein Alches_23280 [Alicyclobacillus hesperidum subsp. aegles]